MPRHYREAPLQSIWEGSGNVNALDVGRALSREPATAAALLDELALAHGADARLDKAVARLRTELSTVDGSGSGARRLVELMALTLQGALLVRHAPAASSTAPRLRNACRACAAMSPGPTTEPSGSSGT